MWGSFSPSTTINDDWRTKWFPYPFGTSERCKTLDEWAAGKHRGNVKPELLSDDWLRPNAVLFFNDYEALILAFCRRRWSRTTTADEEVKEIKINEDFTFSDTVPTSTTAEHHKKWNKQMMAALLYYSSQIMVPELRTRLLVTRQTEGPTWIGRRRKP